MKHISLFIFFFLVTATCFAQDKHFSQFYASPITVNPALSGAFDGKYRVGMVYRDQWRGALDNPFVTFAASLDLRFDIGKRRVFRDAVSGGIVFFTDRVGGIDFNTNQMALVGAYHKALDRRSTQYLSAGIKLGFTQRNLNFEQLSFHDQFNGVDAFSNPTGEDLSANNFSYVDMATGIYYTITPARQTSYYAGVALHHFNVPNASFSQEEGDPKNTLYMKTIVHLGARFPIGEDKQIFPRVMMSSQGPHLQLDAGMNLRMALSDYNSMALHIGAWLRPVKNTSGMNLDAIIAMVGVEMKNVLFGLSYDSNINSIANYGKMHGAFELSIMYLGEYENETILCPTF